MKHDISRLPKWAQKIIADQKAELRKLRPLGRRKKELERLNEVWVDRFGNETRIVDLSTDHLRHILIGGFGRDGQRRIIERELKRRGSL